MENTPRKQPVKYAHIYRTSVGFLRAGWRVDVSADQIAQSADAFGYELGWSQAVMIPAGHTWDDVETTLRDLEHDGLSYTDAVAMLSPWSAP